MKGSPNMLPRDLGEFCKELVSDPDYHASLRMRALNGKLSSGVETEIMARGAGRPENCPLTIHQTNQTNVDINVQQVSVKQMQQMSDEELHTLLALLAKAGVTPDQLSPADRALLEPVKG